MEFTRMLDSKYEFSMLDFDRENKQKEKFIEKYKT